MCIRARVCVCVLVRKKRTQRYRLLFDGDSSSFIGLKGKADVGFSKEIVHGAIQGQEIVGHFQYFISP